MNIGCDIIENKRLEKKGKRFIELVLTAKEQEEYQKKGLSYLCGRFACKEAIMKALPNTKNYHFLDFEIQNKEDGTPYCVGYENMKLSISHEKNYTIAVAVFFE